MSGDFYSQLNRNTVEAVRKNAAFFMQPGETQIPRINDSLSGNPIGGANYFNLMLANDVEGKRRTEYVQMNEALASNPEWFSTLPRENRPRGTLFQEEGQNSHPRYSFVMPAAELAQTMYMDSRDTVRPREHYVPFQSHNAKMDDFEDFVHEQCTNAVNASLSGCAFKSAVPEHELDHYKTRLTDEIARNPQFMEKISNRAYQDVMDLHYIPFDRRHFIEKARDVNSHEFKHLNFVIANHVEDMYTRKKPSFNPYFTELSRQLVVHIENLHSKNSHSGPAVDHAINEFVKKQMRHDRTAGILADTCAGTYIEKTRKMEKTGKIIIKSVALAGALFTSNFPAAAGIAGSLISDIMTRHKVPQHFPDHHQVVINNRVFKRAELQKILNFDNAPFSLTGGGAIGKRDYEIAHLAEKTILGINPRLNKDEYRRDMTHHQVINFYQNAARKMGGGSDHDIMKVANNVMALQELKGDTTLKSCRDNPRAFYACLNQTILDNPQVLDQAISQVNSNTQHRTHSAAMSRR